MSFKTLLYAILTTGKNILSIIYMFSASFFREACSCRCIPFITAAGAAIVEAAVNNRDEND